MCLPLLNLLSTCYSLLFKLFTVFFFIFIRAFSCLIARDARDVIFSLASNANAHLYVQTHHYVQLDSIYPPCTLYVQASNANACANARPCQRIANVYVQASYVQPISMCPSL